MGAPPTSCSDSLSGVTTAKAACFIITKLASIQRLGEVQGKMFHEGFGVPKCQFVVAHLLLVSYQLAF